LHAFVSITAFFRSACAIVAPLAGSQSYTTLAAFSSVAPLFVPLIWMTTRCCLLVSYFRSPRAAVPEAPLLLTVSWTVVISTAKVYV